MFCVNMMENGQNWLQVYNKLKEDVKEEDVYTVKHVEKKSGAKIKLNNGRRQRGRRNLTTKE